MQGIDAMQITGTRKEYYSISDIKNEIFMWEKIEVDFLPHKIHKTMPYGLSQDFI